MSTAAISSARNRTVAPAFRELCSYAEWDSAFFGRRIASSKTGIVEAGTLEAILRWCEDSEIDCLYFQAASNHDETVRLLEERRFQLVDIRMTFERPLQRTAGATDRRPLQTRHNIPSDLRALKDIARVSYHDTRFYYDAHFSRERVDQLYETWIENSCNGFAEDVLVAEDTRHPIGFITCHLKGDGRGQIGLVGVAPAARGAGIGRALVEDAVQWFTERGSTAVSVVTQARNLGAMRLYESCGFKVQQSHLWYHRWFR